METNTSEPVSAPAAGSSKKKLIIGAVVVLALVAYGAMSNLKGRIASQVVRDTTGGVVSAGADGQMTVKTDQGTVTTGNKLPSDWPSDIPVYSGATVQYSASSNPQTGKAGSYLMLQTTAAVDAIVNFYKTQLVAQGWKITATANVSGGTVIAASKGDRELGMNVIPGQDSEGTTITIAASAK